MGMNYPAIAGVDPYAGLSVEELAKLPVQLQVKHDGTNPVWAPAHEVLADEQMKDSAAQEVGFKEAVQKSFTNGGNYGVQILTDVTRMANNPATPGYSPTDFVEINKNRIPENQAWRFMQTRSPGEAHAMLSDMEANHKASDTLARRGGFSTFVAQGLAGIIDIDTPLAMVSGGLSAEAKLGLNATKYGRMLSGATGGLVAQTGAAWAGYGSDPDADWTSIPAAGLAGIAFGTLGGYLAHGPAKVLPHAAEEVSAAANRARTAVAEEFGTTVAEGAPLAARDLRSSPTLHEDVYGTRAAQEAERAAAEAPAGEAKAAKPDATVTEVKPEDESWLDHEPQTNSSVGASQLGTTGGGVNTIRSERIRNMIKAATARDQQLGLTDLWYDAKGRIDGVSTAVANAARRFHDIIKASPLVSDFDRLFRSGSAVARNLAYDIMESPTGIIRNNRSASALFEHYHKELQSALVPMYDAFDEWAARTQQASHWRKLTDTTLKQKFDAQVFEEMQARRYEPTKPRNVDPAVTKAADALDQWSAKDVEIGQGRPGEGMRKGYDTLKPESGYLPQRWLGSKMQKLIESGTSRQLIERAIQEGYRAMHPSMSGADAKVWAQAVVDRALHQGQGISMNLIGILQGDGRTLMEDTLRRNGISAQETERLITGLTGNMEEKGKAGHTKQRIDIDGRFVSSDGVRISDLMDTDITALTAQRSRQGAGQAALARKGISSKADWDSIVDAIMQEQQANGKSAMSGKNVREKVEDFLSADRHLSKEDMDAFYSYFSGQPIAGGLSPTYSRMKKLTNLSLLNQLGLTQFAEFGPMIASVGWKRFSEIAGPEIMGHLRNQDSELVKEMKHMNILVPEERLFRDDLTHEFEKGGPSENEFMRRVDGLMNKGQRLQGFTSLFYQVRNIQQRLAVTSAADRIFRALRDNDNVLMTPERMADVGIDSGMAARMQTLIQNGTIEFKDGHLHKMNMDKWAPQDAENLALSLNRNVNQLVQKAMVGESSYLFHKDGFASLFTHLKSFPLLAVEKQAYRALRHADDESAGTFLYGLATAGAAYSIKQLINGKTDELSAEKIAKGAFGMSNLTGWIPMWTDPLAGMLGMDSLKFNNYMARSGGAGVLSIPASLTTLDKMAGIPGAYMNTVFGNMDNKDVRAFQAMPIIGNAYGFSLMFNALKEDKVKKQKPVAAPEDAALPAL